MKNIRHCLKGLAVTLAGAILMISSLEADRPQLLVQADQRDAIVKKVTSVDWAKSAYEEMKRRVDKYVAKTEVEPDWVTSRLAMNWDTHYTRAMTLDSRTIGGEGRAPVATPRFAGARDWKTDYERKSLDDSIPYNDRAGEIMFTNIETGKDEWVSTSITGHLIERINNEIMSLAADASFVYWITGDERYAEFAAPILWTYMEGLHYVDAPYIGDKDGGPSRIIGVTSYEVIHEGIIHSMAVAYDFLHDYISANEKMDVGVIEEGLKKIVDRVIAGGGRKGNWNLHQAMKITYGGLALESNDAYDDGKGREYYVDIVLNADLPHQLGVMHVIREGYDQKTAVWPEVPGYAFSTTSNIMEVASLLSNDPNGRRVLEDPIMGRAILGQLKQMYPNGASHALGDTSYTRLATRGAELMLSWAMQEGDKKLTELLSAALHNEIDSGKYSRDHQRSMVAITRYASELPKGNFKALANMITPTYFAEPINLVMLRNDPKSGDERYALGATMFGTKGGHMHANGLATELYGAGYVLGIDSGRGISYWQPDHTEYYALAPAHNTVIVNGNSTYGHSRSGKIAMEVEAVEPAFDEKVSNPNLTYLTSSFQHVSPSATQQRTLALVRIDETTAFYFDVFRSKRDEEDPDQYHDWLYHGMADSVELEGLNLEPSSLLTSAEGNMKGYDYFSDERSIKTSSVIHATFPLEISPEQENPRSWVELDKVAMDVWVLGGEGRQVFTVKAPANRGARHNYDEKYWNHLMPTLVVRQTGEAWDRPFVSVYEPSLQKDGRKIKKIVETAQNTWVVSGADWSATLTLDGVELSLSITK